MASSRPSSTDACCRHRSSTIPAPLPGRSRGAGRSASSAATAPGWPRCRARIGVPVLEPAGGRLDPLNIGPGSVVAIAPLDVVTTPEGNGGAYDPAIQGGVVLADGVIGVDREGFVAEVRAPPGSHVYLPGAMSAETPEVLVVGEDGALEVDVAVPGRSDGRRGRAGDDDRRHARRSRLHQLVEPAPGRWASRTSAPRRRRRSARPRVIVAGRAPPYADVEVAGKAVVRGRPGSVLDER